MADVTKALRHTLIVEGVRFGASGQPVPGRTGYVNDPDDPGGETNFGVTRRNARRYGRYFGSMRRIPFATVVEIYRRRFWNKLRLSEVPSQLVAEELFDTAVNCGPAVAGRFIQRTLNLFNNQEKRYPDVVVDGKVGPTTIRTLKRALRFRGFESVFHKALNCLQGSKYFQICEKRKKSEKYAFGWFRARIS
jgi:lysozyme family protein